MTFQMSSPNELSKLRPGWSTLGVYWEAGEDSGSLLLILLEFESLFISFVLTFLIGGTEKESWVDLAATFVEQLV